MTTWEISRIGFARFWQANRWKTLCPAFSLPKEGTGSIYSWLWGWQYSAWCPMHNTPSNAVFHPFAGRSAIDGNPGRRFIFLLGAAPCHCAGPDNSADGQGVWDFCFTCTESKAGVHLWNATGFGLAWGLHLLFPKGNQQPYKQSAKENPDCPGTAGLYKKRLRCRL